MDEDIRLLEDLYEEMCGFCNIHSYSSTCEGCYIQELRVKYGLDDEDTYCSALYIVVKLLGDNKDSIDYYMDNIIKLRKTCFDEMGEHCFDCKYNDSLKAVVPCYGYTIGMSLLKEV